MITPAAEPQVVTTTYDLEAQRNIFDGITPWSGMVKYGYAPTFLGTMIDNEFRKLWFNDDNQAPERFVSTTLPTVGDGELSEFWFEAANWVLAAREAKGNSPW
jgi:hypothetical protein